VELNILASDTMALLDMARRMIFLNDGDLAILSAHGYTILSIENGEPLRGVEAVNMTVEVAEKQGYPHFTLKEIMGSPRPRETRSAYRLNP